MTLDTTTSGWIEVAIVAAIAGVILGFAADRFATRWPDHDDEHLPGRRIGWRTAVCLIAGGFALGGLILRFAPDWLVVAVFGAWFVTLIVGLATDLDQRLLPDVLTLPVLPIGLVYAASGLNPLVGGDFVPAIMAAVLIPAILYLPSIPFGAGAFGMGDVKLLAGVGLMVGAERALGGVLVGLLVAGAVLIVLLAARRISRRSYVPFGPFLIFGALWAALIR